MRNTDMAPSNSASAPSASQFMICSKVSVKSMSIGLEILQYQVFGLQELR